MINKSPQNFKLSFGAGIVSEILEIGGLFVVLKSFGLGGLFFD
jgi:hypothetical protein